MAARNRARAKRRIEARTRRNALALDAAVEIAAEKPLKLARARTCTKLEELFNRGVIDLNQRHAGDRLYKDYVRSGEQLGQLTMKYSPWASKGSSRQVNDAPFQVDARQRFEAALQAVGPWLCQVLIHVCVVDQPPSEWAGLNGKAPRDGPPVLRLALDALNYHYRSLSRQAA